MIDLAKPHPLVKYFLFHVHVVKGDTLSSYISTHICMHLVPGL